MIAASHQFLGEETRRRGVLRRLGIALFALVLAFLTSVAQISYACGEEPAHPAPDDTGAYDAGGRVSSDYRIPAAPGLGCLILELIQTTLISAGSFMLCYLPVLNWLGSLTASTRLREPVPYSLHIRAPPQP